MHIFFGQSTPEFHIFSLSSNNTSLRDCSAHISCCRKWSLVVLRAVVWLSCQERTWRNRANWKWYSERTTLSCCGLMVVWDIKMSWKKKLQKKRREVIPCLLMRGGGDEMKSSPDYGNNRAVWRNSLASFNIWFGDMNCCLVCSGELSLAFVYIELFV